MTPLEETLKFHFEDEVKQKRFEDEITRAFNTLKEINVILVKPLDNDLGVLRERLCRYIECAGKLGTIQNNTKTWLTLARHEMIQLNISNGMGKKEAEEQAIYQLYGLVELSELPGIFHTTIKDQKAMIKSIMGQEMGGGYGG